MLSPEEKETVTQAHKSLQGLASNPSPSLSSPEVEAIKKIAEALGTLIGASAGPAADKSAPIGPGWDKDARARETARVAAMAGPLGNRGVVSDLGQHVRNEGARQTFGVK